MKGRKTIVGAAAMAAATTVRIGLQLIALPIVARLVGPDAYGVVALATPIVLFLLMFGDAGLGASLVRTENPSHELESSIFWASIGLGLVFALLLLAAARPLGALLAQPELPPILIGLCPMFPLATLAVLPLSRIQRNGRFKIAALCDVASGVAGMAAAVFGAVHGYGAWSLVAQQLALWFVRLLTVYAAAGFLPRLCFRWDLIRSSLGFGMGLAGANVLSFLVTSGDKVIVGAVLGPAALGFYALAYQIVAIPVVVLASAHYSLFPAISEAFRDGGRPAAIYVEGFRVILMIAAPVMTGLALTGDLATSLLLGDAWAPVAPLMTLMVPAGLLLSLFGVNSALLYGLGRSDVEFRVSLARTVVTLGAALAAAVLGGASAVAMAVSASAVVITVFYLRTILPIAGIPLRTLLEAALAPLLASGALAVAVLSFRGMLAADASRTMHLTLCVAVGVLTYVMALYVGGRDRFAADVFMIKKILSKRDV